MKINARIALVSFFSLALGALAGCSADVPPDGPVGSPPSNSSRTPSQGTTQAPPEGGGTQSTQEGAGAPAAGGETPQPGTSTPSGKEPSDPGTGTKQPTQADAQCVASCNSGLKSKCEGDDTFCEDVCISLTSTELSCLSSAPTCDKPEWIRCMPDENSGGSK